MNIDGTNTLACLKPVAESVTNGKIKIYPLPHLRTRPPRLAPHLCTLRRVCD
jgi:hypothetical protein